MNIDGVFGASVSTVDGKWLQSFEAEVDDGKVLTDAIALIKKVHRLEARLDHATLGNSPKKISRSVFVVESARSSNLKDGYVCIENLCSCGRKGTGRCKHLIAIDMANQLGTIFFLFSVFHPFNTLLKNW